MEGGELNDLTGTIIGRAIEVHQHLGGAGLLESIYEEALAFELKQAGLRIERQVKCPIIYKGHELGDPLRLDLLVEKQVIVECKAVAQFHPIFKCQVLTYMRLSGIKVGLILNFGAETMREGITRIVHQL